MIRHPKGHQSHNDDANGDAYESESAGIALAQTDRFRRCVILHLSQKLIG
jgi:hypothetical protein